MRNSQRVYGTVVLHEAQEVGVQLWVPNHRCYSLRYLFWGATAARPPAAQVQMKNPKWV